MIVFRYRVDATADDPRDSKAPPFTVNNVVVTSDRQIDRAAPVDKALVEKLVNGLREQTGIAFKMDGFHLEKIAFIDAIEVESF